MIGCSAPTPGRSARQGDVDPLAFEGGVASSRSRTTASRAAKACFELAFDTLAAAPTARRSSGGSLPRPLKQVGERALATEMGDAPLLEARPRPSHRRAAPSAVDAQVVETALPVQVPDWRRGIGHGSSVETS